MCYQIHFSEFFLNLYFCIINCETMNIKHIPVSTALLLTTNSVQSIVAILVSLIYKIIYPYFAT